MSNRLPLFPLRTVLFPGGTIPLIIFEPRYRSLVRYCLRHRAPFGVVMIVEGDEVAAPGSESPVIKEIGTTARIVRCSQVDDGRFLIEVVGESRFQIEEIAGDGPYPSAEVTIYPEPDEPIELLSGLAETVCSQFRDYLKCMMSADNRQLSGLQLPSDPATLAFAVASALDIALEDKQRLLEAPSTIERLTMETELLDLLIALSGASLDDDLEARDRQRETGRGSCSQPEAEDEDEEVMWLAPTVKRLSGAAAVKLMSRN